MSTITTHAGRAVQAGRRSASLPHAAYPRLNPRREWSRVGVGQMDTIGVDA
jgi:hypothetical protein